MWKLDGSQALLQSPELRCQLDLASPTKGLTALEVGRNSKPAHRSVDAELMQISLPGKTARLADAYVRGEDLVATYAESSVYPCRTRVYWRFDHETDYFGIQLIISVQTLLLDATPGLTVTSRLPGPAQLVEGATVLVPWPASDLCYAELVDDSNLESTSVRETRVTNQLFPGSLEKGVIRCARILGCFLPASSAAHTVHTLHERFVHSALPLTT